MDIIETIKENLTPYHLKRFSKYILVDDINELQDGIRIVFIPKDKVRKNNPFYLKLNYGKVKNIYMDEELVCVCIRKGKHKNFFYEDNYVFKEKMEEKSLLRQLIDSLIGSH